MRRIDEFESLRGLMALWVVLSHVIPQAGIMWSALPGPLSLIGNGPLAVDEFIILSGFVIFLMLENRPESYGAFITRRFFRVFAVCAVCLVAAVLTLDVTARSLREAPWSHPAFSVWLLKDSESQARLPQHVAAHLTMLHGAVPESILPRSQFALLAPA